MIKTYCACSFLYASVQYMYSTSLWYYNIISTSETSLVTQGFPPELLSPLKFCCYIMLLAQNYSTYN